MKDLVSIIIPSYNRGHLIHETLESLLEQDYTYWECIIVDDASTDNTEEVVRLYQEKDNRIKFFKRPKNRPKGANACRNYGFEKSNGAYINWFDSDDLMLPDFISSRLEILMHKQELHAVIGYAIYFNEDGTEEVIKPENLSSENALYRFVVSQLFFPTNGPLWRKEFLENKPLFDESFQKVQDIEFHFRMLLNELHFEFYQKKALYKMRRAGNRISNKDTLSLEKLQNVLDYHYSTFRNREAIHLDIKDAYIDATSKKVLGGFYELMSFKNTLKQRISLFKKNRPKLKEVIANYSLIQKIQLNLVLILVVLFKKGFKYFVNA
ncbi:glycosyltransferase [Flavobacteriaceae bacterium R38]|nr:glycosyltransferase [Flavobacteriaceae bacterium R38]